MHSTSQTQRRSFKVAARAFPGFIRAVLLTAAVVSQAVMSTTAVAQGVSAAEPPTRSFSAGNPAVVSGVVYEDRNGNGSRDAGEPGVPGVTIGIAERPDPPAGGLVPDFVGALQAAARAIASADHVVTDADGRYRFEALELDHVVMLTELPPAHPGSQYHVTRGEEGYQAVASPGASVTNLDFGLQLLGPAALEGVVYEDRNGNGSRDAGEPGVPGVTIGIAERPDPPAGGLVPDFVGALQAAARAIASADHVVTDADGRYRFEALELDHVVMLTELPRAGYRVAEGADGYLRQVDPGQTASNLTFGLRRETTPPSESTTVSAGQPPAQPGPAAGAQTPTGSDTLADRACVREGFWTPSRQASQLEIRPRDGCRLIVVSGIEGGEGPATVTFREVAGQPGRYTGSLSSAGGPLRYTLEIRTPEHLVGTFDARGISGTFDGRFDRPFPN